MAANFSFLLPSCFFSNFIILMANAIHKILRSPTDTFQSNSTELIVREFLEHANIFGKDPQVEYPGKPFPLFPYPFSPPFFPLISLFPLFSSLTHFQSLYTPTRPKKKDITHSSLLIMLLFA